MLMYADWCWLMPTNCAWGWLKLLSADWCSNKVQLGFLLSERTSGASPVIFEHITSCLSTQYQQWAHALEIDPSCNGTISLRRLGATSRGGSLQLLRREELSDWLRGESWHLIGHHFAAQTWRQQRRGVCWGSKNRWRHIIQLPICNIYVAKIFQS